MFQISRNILPEFRQRFATAYSPWPRTSPNQVAFVMSHVLWGCSPSVFVSNVILTRASIDLMCRTFVSVQQAKKWCLHQIYIYTAFVFNRLYLQYIYSQNNSSKSLIWKRFDQCRSSRPMFKECQCESQPGNSTAFPNTLLGTEFVGHPMIPFHITMKG